jgi:hypothetical protein
MNIPDHCAYRPGRTLLPALIILLAIAAGLAGAQPNATVIPWLSPEYRYIQVPWGDIAGFESPGFADSTWATGAGGFGSGGGCTLSSPAYINSTWSLNSDILLRKTFLIPAGTANLSVHIAIDNDVQVFINGHDISGGLRTHEGCAQRDSYIFVAPDSILHGGVNVLAVRGRDRGVEAYLDVEVTADLPQRITISSTADSGPGSLREAIATANASPAVDTLAFSIVTEALVTITPLSPLPPITSPVILDGTTQPGYSGTPLVELNGELAGAGATGLDILAGSSTVQALIINRFGGDGIHLHGGGNNTLSGNYIGVNATGSAALPNGGNGILITSGSAGNTIGPANLISGNGRSGLSIGGWESSASGTMVQGNRIGTDATGGAAVPNTEQGVLITDGSSNSTIGGTGAGAGNVIAHNLLNGVLVTGGSGNAILGNAIAENGRLGIDLNGDGVTPNVPPGTGTGANNSQNFPVLSFAAFDLQGIAGTLHAPASSTYRVEFFRNTVADGSGYGEGSALIGSATVTTDTGGAASFFQEFPGQLTGGEYVTATATGTGNNTSEFSSVLVSARAKVFGNHYVVNSTLSGIPLHWPAGNGEFAVSTGVPAGLQNAIVQGYAAWSALPQVTHTYAGTTPSTVWGGSPDGVNNNVWVTSGWGALTGADDNVIAVTRVRYNALTGQITDADIAFDAQHFVWQAGSSEAAAMDVQNATTHEAGHVNGLGDIYNPGDPGYIPAMGDSNAAVTMYGLIASGETSKQSLEAPDSAGIGYIYSHIPAERVDLVLVFDGSASYASAQHAFDASLNSALSLVPKMRTGDRLGVVKMPGTVVFPLTAMGDSIHRSGAATAINALLAGGPAAIGSGLQTGQSLLSASALATNAPAMILFSAGEENTSPGAMAVLGPISAAGTRVFTLGFAGSGGQGLCNTIADSTGGAYYQAADSTINQVVTQIWNSLTGQQYTFSTVASSDTFQNVPQPGISWQGPVDKGTTTAQPGIQWQGPTKGALAARPGALGTTSSYVLSLLPPGGSTLIDSAYAANNPGLGIQFFSGPSFQYFNISRPTPGSWTLYVYGRQLPVRPEPVAISISAFTDITMDAGFDRIVYNPGETVSMNVALSRGGQSSPDRHTTGGDPIIDARVQARITIPGGGGEILVPFSNLGAGVYRGSFGNTLTPGTYNVRFQAVSDSVERTSDRALYVVPPFDGRQVLLATNSIVAKEDLRVHAGDVVVNNRRRDAGVMPELVLGENAITPTGFNLKADRILVGRRSVIGSNVYYNTLVNRGTITGATVTPVAIPVIPLLPPFKLPDASEDPVTVGNGRTLVLAAGRYGDVTIQPKGVLRLTGGVYHFKSLWVKSKGKVTCEASVEVRIVRDLHAETESYLGPAQGSLIDATDIVFYVVGGTGMPYSTKAVMLGPHATVFANLYTSMGTITFKEETQATGSFIADNIVVGEEVQLTLASAFATPAAAPPGPWDREPGLEQDAPVPAAFSLAQNFPNPFNPTTDIRYQLAGTASVSLTVYDLLGQAVRTLVNEIKDAGSYEAVWDGRNDQGQNVGSGIFFYRLQAGTFVDTRRMVLLR